MVVVKERHVMISFVAIGDFGARTPLRDEMIGAIHSFGPRADAVLALGDNFYDRGVVSADDPRWKEWRDAFRPTSPWLAVLGNHDYLGDIHAQIGRNRSDGWFMPSRYYDRIFPFEDGGGGVHVVCLDTFDLSPMESAANSFGMGMSAEEWGRLEFQPSIQLGWLDQVLAMSRATWKVVIGHYPIYSCGSHGDNGELMANLLPILKRHRVDFYISGHDHNISHFKEDDTQFVVSGTGSRLTHARPKSGYSTLNQDRGVFALQCHPTHARFGFIDRQGEWFFHRTAIPNTPRVIFSVRRR